MILEVKDLVAGYEQMLIRNLFFSVPEPAFIAIIGHNGCGKSTLFKTFINQISYSGHILLNGSDLKELRNPAGKGLLAHLAQKNVVTFPIKVKDLVVMGSFRKKHFLENYATEDYETVALLLQKLQISHLAERNFPDLRWRGSSSEQVPRAARHRMGQTVARDFHAFHAQQGTPPGKLLYASPQLRHVRMVVQQEDVRGTRLETSAHVPGPARPLCRD